MVCISNRLLKVFVAERFLEQAKRQSRALHVLRLVEMTAGGMLSRDDWRVFVMSTAVETSHSSGGTKLHITHAGAMMSIRVFILTMSSAKDHIIQKHHMRNSCNSYHINENLQIWIM